MKILSAVFIYLLLSFFSTAGAYTIFEENGKVGLKNSTGVVLIPALYDAIGWSNGEFSVSGNVTGYSINKQWGLIDLGNNKITPARYETLRAVEGHFIIAQKKLNYAPWLATGCIKEDGKEVIPFVYDGISVSSLRAIVYSRVGGQYKYGLVDLNNRTLIAQQYKNISSVGTLRYAVQNFDNKTALFTENGKQISGFTIDSLSDFQKDYAVVFEGKHQGLINREGQLKLPIEYRDIIIDNQGKIKARKADEWFFLDGQNNKLRQFHADSVIALHKDRLKIKTANQTQLTDQILKPVREKVFTDIKKFSGNRAVYRLENHYGVLAYDGSIILPPLYRQIEIGKDYIIANQHAGGKDAWVLFDSLGVKQPQKAYEFMKPFDAYFAVRNRGAWGIINHTGQEIISCTYDSIIQSSHNLFVVKFRGAYGIVNSNEAWKTAPKPDKLFIINEDRYIAYSSPTTFLKSMNGTVIYFTTNPIEIHQDYFLEFLPSGNVWQIDMKGVIANRQVIPQETYERIFEESEGYRAIKRNGRYGFIDSRGRLRIANRYEEVHKFSDGFAAIKILGKWGFINQQDNISVQPIYDEVWPFKDGYALVKQKDYFGLIDRYGKQVLPARYDKIDVLATGNLLIQVNGLKGLADPQGKIFIHPKYNSITDLGNTYVIAMRDNKYGVITSQGISTIPMLYDYISYDAYNNVFLALKRSEWVDVNL